MQLIGPAGQQTYWAYVLNIPATATTATTTTAIFPNLKTKIVITWSFLKLGPQNFEWK